MEEQKTGGACSCGDCGSCGKAGSGMHWACCIVPILSRIFWVGGIVSLVLAWFAGEGLIWGKTDAFWYLNALALGVLAIGGRGKKWGVHGFCKDGSCKDGVCKDGVCCK